jgi:hypothetical protein
MLERRKLLRETDSQRTPDGILRVYEHRKTGEVYLIRDPNIPLAQVESFQNEVIVLLENNGRMPEPLLPLTPTAPDEPLVLPPTEENELARPNSGQGRVSDASAPKPGP